MKYLICLTLIAAASCSDANTAPPDPGRISLAPAQIPALVIGQSTTIRAVITNDKGNVISGAFAVWKTDDAAIVRLTTLVNNQVLAVGLAPGSTTVTAYRGQMSASVVIVVSTPGPLAVIDVGPKESVLSIGSTRTLTVSLRDSAGAQLSRPVTFSSSAPNVVSVGASTGVLTGMAEGTAVISATADGKAATVIVTVPSRERAFLWTAAEGMVSLGVLPGFDASRATAISSTGIVAGYLTSPANQTGAFSWTREGGMKLLATLPEGSSSMALGVNAIGQVVGLATAQGSVRHAVMWEPDGTIRDLGVSFGSAPSTSTAINDAGQVVGYTDNAGSNKSFVWSSTEGFIMLDGVAGTAYAISPSGRVVGETADGPFTWTRDARVALLPLLPGDKGGSAVAISSNGSIVGRSGTDYCYFDDDDYCGPNPAHAVSWNSELLVTGFGAQLYLGARDVVFRGVNASGEIVGVKRFVGQAFRWSAATGYRELGTLRGHRFSDASAINDAGEVVGFSYTP